MRIYLYLSCYIKIGAFWPNDLVKTKTNRGKMTPPKDKPEKTRRQKEKFTNEQNALIKKYFEKHVKETKAPSTTLCKQFLDTYPAGRESKHIQDKVRGLQ